MDITEDFLAMSDYSLAMAAAKWPCCFRTGLGRSQRMSPRPRYEASKRRDPGGSPLTNRKVIVTLEAS